MLSVIDGNSPAGTSVRTVAQFAMNLNSGVFEKKKTNVQDGSIHLKQFYVISFL